MRIGQSTKTGMLTKTLLFLYKFVLPKVVTFPWEALTLGLLDTSGCQLSLAAGQHCCAVSATAWKLENLESYSLTQLFVLLCSDSFDRGLSWLLWPFRSILQTSGTVLVIPWGNGVTIRSISCHYQSFGQKFIIFLCLCLKVFYLCKMLMFVIRLSNQEILFSIFQFLPAQMFWIFITCSCLQLSLFKEEYRG